MKIQSFLMCSVLMLCGHVASIAQKSKAYDLPKLLKENKLEIHGSAEVLAEKDKQGISVTGVVWLKGVSFSEGNIELDIRGKDIPQQSFLGIACHGVDSLTYDAIYFRPFNFQAKDSVRKIHAVQYISEPDFPWDRLRKEHNGMYEKGITPAPDPSSWFHARIEVKGQTIKVYVNHATTPSLVVDKLNNRKDGRIGFWSFWGMDNPLKGDFANLLISK